MQPPPVQYAKTQFGDIAYRVMGSGPPDLLLINPMSRSIETLWDFPANAALLQRLAQFCRLTVFDRRGSGISDPLPADLAPTWEDWLDDVLAVLDHVGIESAALLAERDAAAAALVFASSHPQRVRALLLCNTSARFRVARGYPCGEGYERSEQLSHAWDQTWGTEQMVATTRPTLAGDPEYVRWVTRMQRMAYSPRRAGEEFRYLINFDARAVLSSIRAPTLILHRRDFAVIPLAHAEYLAEHIVDSCLEILPGGDMDVLLPGDEQPLELIEAFLANVHPANVHPANRGERALATVLRMRAANPQQVEANLGETLDRLRAIVRFELLQSQGRAMQDGSDEFLAGFDGPARALRFAAAVRRASRDQLHLEIQAGLHIGECERVGDTFSGAAVNIGAAVVQVARPGEVLVTAAAMELVAGSGIELRSIGMQRLDGVSGDWELFALEA